jgi:hypothetical protein
MYVKDRFVYVKDGIDLSTSSNTIYLRNEGQLLQGGIAASPRAPFNKGLGKLSVFQEGTTDNFSYNYWCSPVGKTPALGSTTTNEPFGISLLNRPTDNITSVTATNFNQTFGYNSTTSATTLNIADYWIWAYRSGLNYSDWQFIGSTTTLAAGEGFSMKGVLGTDTANTIAIGESTPNNAGSNQRYDFRGKPNDGDISITVANGKQTLTGNPYPSAIDLSAFLTNNLNCTGIAYFWDDDKTANSHVLTVARGGYGTYSPISRSGTGLYVPATFIAYDNLGVAIPFPTYGSGITGTGIRYFAPIGQGFMIEGNAAGTSVIMKNAYRVYQKENSLTSVFGRNINISSHLPETSSVSGFDYTTVSTEEVPHLRLNVTINDFAKKQLVVAFDSTATDGVDRAMDAKAADNPMTTDCFISLNDENYVLSVIDYNINKKIPLVFNSDVESSFKIQLGEMINFSDAQNVFVHDKIADTYTNIVNGSFNLTLPAGINKTQYEITFVNSSLANEDFITNDIKIFQNNTAQMLTIANPKLLDVASVKLYDVAGKLIINKENLKVKDSYEFSTSTLSDGVYVVRLLTTENKNVSQKVIISNVK